MLVVRASAMDTASSSNDEDEADNGDLLFTLIFYVWIGQIVLLMDYLRMVENNGHFTTSNSRESGIDLLQYHLKDLFSCLSRLLLILNWYIRDLVNPE